MERFWGAAVFIAVMVLLLHFLLDGAGSESQFRRVTDLRKEPPSIIDADGNHTTQVIPGMQAVGPEGAALLDEADVLSHFRPDVSPGEPETSGNLQAGQEVRDAFEQIRKKAPLTAWVVQAGSFLDEVNALAVRDQLRQGGFASFVRDRDLATEPFRVLVGPMISEESANSERARVVKLLGVDALIMTYP